MVTSLFKYDRIRTTDAKAKAIRQWADHLVTLAKRGDLHARRQALAIVREKNVVHKLFAEAADRYGSVNGGYTRIVKLGRRPGDCAPMSLIELIAREKSTSLKKPGSKKESSPAPRQESSASALSKTADKTETSSEAEKTGDESAAGAQAPAESGIETQKDT